MKRQGTKEGTGVSRIDIACDDRAGHLSMDNVLNKIQTNEVNSRMTARSTGISFNGIQCSGATAYISVPSSNFRVRVYDKDEQLDMDSESPIVCFIEILFIITTTNRQRKSQ